MARGDSLATQLASVFCYQRLHSGTAGAGQSAFWGCPEANTIDEVLLGPAGADCGLLRVVTLHGVQNQPIRPAGKPWEAGGIYDLDIRVRDIEAIYAELEARGWAGVHVPFQYTMGPVVVKHCELIGPERIVLALIQRVDPPLGPDAGFDQVSNAFNSTQLVYDDELEAHDVFYQEALGFDCLIDTEIRWEPPGENVFGLPYNVALAHPAPVRIYHPTGEMQGSVEICSIRGLTGEHYGRFALPRNRGSSALRFPVSDLTGYASRIEAAGVALTRPITQLELAPYGDVSMFAVRAPGGAWLEFFQPTAP
ncbi:MAG: hypothetical protein AB8B96_19465 [Lysobacterales bacterium]